MTDEEYEKEWEEILTHALKESIENGLVKEGEL